jgi:DNA repair photolyase
VYVSITTLDRCLARTLEPRAAAPQRRLEAVRRLAQAGVPTGVLFAPVIPALNDHELEPVLSAAAAAGARHAGYTLLRLPHEVKELFREWLATHAPLKAAHVLSRVHQARGGRANDARFGTRMTGDGDYARMLAQRFTLACRRLGLNRDDPVLDGSGFRVPGRSGVQLGLFEAP